MRHDLPSTIGTTVPLETATTVSDLVTSNPAASDPLSGADDHIRLIKATLKNTFGHTGQMTNAYNQVILSGGSAAKPTYTFAAEPTLGFFRSAAGTMSVVGGRLSGGNEPGQLGIFVVAPVSLGTATAHTGREWLELNGATYYASDYPALALRFGVSSGTFTVPDMYSQGRFPRSRRSGVSERMAEAPTVGAHTHPDVTVTSAAETQDHVHAFSGTTGSMNRSNPHSHQYVGPNGYSSTGGGSFTIGGAPATLNTTATDINHEHAFSGWTGGRSSAHNHTVTVNTPANTGTVETRPEAMSFIFAVKT